MRDSSYFTLEMGTVKFFNNSEGRLFGFIIADSDAADVFFHYNNKEDMHHPNRLPKKGDRVEFFRLLSDKGPKVESWGFDSFVSFPDLCHDQLGTTSQRGAHYVGGLSDTPNLSFGLRFQGTAAMYHSLRIHRYDVETFVNRYKKWEKAKLASRKRVLVYNSEDAFFFSTQWQQPYLPDGFLPLTFNLPFMAEEWQRQLEGLHDGIVANLQDVLRTKLAGLRHIPNPSPEYELETSGYFKPQHQRAQ